MEVEDDVFFADLSKRITLLIMDDDEVPVTRCPSVSLQDFTQGRHPTAPSPPFYEQICRRESKGTGVFIPQSSLPRKKNRQGKATSFNTRSQRQPDRSSGISNSSFNGYNSKKY